MLPSIRPSELLVGGMKYAIVYMSCRGWNLRGWIWSYLFSMVVVEVVSKGMATQGAIFHVLEILMWQCVGWV